jgi:hypothetical protein
MKNLNTLFVVALISSVDSSPTKTPELLPYITAPSWTDIALSYADNSVL